MQTSQSMSYSDLYQPRSIVLYIYIWFQFISLYVCICSTHSSHNPPLSCSPIIKNLLIIIVIKFSNWRVKFHQMNQLVLEQGCTWESFFWFLPPSYIASCSMHFTSAIPPSRNPLQISLETRVGTTTMPATWNGAYLRTTLIWKIGPGNTSVNEFVEGLL